jgi:DNA-directed RNA polymerase II subunit RPB11
LEIDPEKDRSEEYPAERTVKVWNVYVPVKMASLLLVNEKGAILNDKTDDILTNTKLSTANKEDHTLDNLVLQCLFTHAHVDLAAYKVDPHYPCFELRVTPDGSITPEDAVMKCCEDVKKELDVFKGRFQTVWLAKKIVSEGDEERIEREEEGGRE